MSISRFTQSTVACIALLVAMTATTSQAALVISFSPDGTDPGFTATAGNTVVIPIFALETPPNTELSTSGLTSFGLRGTFDPLLGQITDITRNGAFFLGAALDPADNNAGTFEIFGGSIAPQIANNGAIQLGTITYQALQDATNIITLTQRFPNREDFTDGAFNEIDESFFGPGGDRAFNALVNAIAIPEPSAFALMAMVGGIVGARRLRRTKRS